MDGYKKVCLDMVDKWDEIVGKDGSAKSVRIFMAYAIHQWFENTEPSKRANCGNGISYILTNLDRIQGVYQSSLDPIDNNTNEDAAGLVTMPEPVEVALQAKSLIKDKKFGENEFKKLTEYVEDRKKVRLVEQTVDYADRMDSLARKIAEEKEGQE